MDLQEVNSLLGRAQAEGNQRMVDLLTARQSVLMSRQAKAKGAETKTTESPKPMLAEPDKGEGFFSQVGNTAADVGKSLGTGVAKGVVGLPGLPADIGSIANLVRNYAQSKITGREFKDIAQENAIPALENWGSKAFQKSAEDLGGFKFYEPQTKLGKIAEVGGEFAGGGGFIGPGGLKAIPLARNAATSLGVGIASETAGQAGEMADTALGTKWIAPAARISTALGAGLAAPGSTGATTTSKRLGEVFRDASPAQIQEAKALVQKARADNINLPLPLALDHVTQGTTGGKLIADLEAHPRGAQLTEWLNQNTPRTREIAAGEVQGMGPAASASNLDQQLQAALEAERAQSPVGRAVAREVATAPRTTPEEAGRVIQPEMQTQQQGLKQAADTIGNEYEQLYQSAPATKPQYPAQRDPTTGRMLPLERGQVQAQPIIEGVQDAASVQAGGIQRGLDNVVKMLTDRETGRAVTTAEQLHNARKALDDVISKAERSGQGGKVAVLTEQARNPISAELKSIPGWADTDTRFAAAKQALSPYVEKAGGRLEGPLTAHPSDVTRQLADPAVAEQFARQFPLGSPAHTAMNDRIVSEAMTGMNDLNSVNPAKIEKYLTDNADLLQHFPEAQIKLEGLGQNRAAMDQVLTGKLKTLYDKGEATTKQWVNEIFMPKSSGEVADISGAIAKLNARDPVATKQLVAHVIEQRMAENLRRNVPGEPASSGAKFANALAGEPGQREAFLDTVKQVFGDEKAQRWGDLIDVLQATGKRQGTGSPTAGRAARYEELGTPGVGKEAAKAGAAGIISGATGAVLSVARAASQRLNQWAQNASVKELTNFMMDPSVDNQLRVIAQSGPGARTNAALGRLGVLAERQQTVEDNKTKEPLRFTVRAKPSN